jgi:hypothetical protein
VQVREHSTQRGSDPHDSVQELASVPNSTTNRGTDIDRPDAAPAPANSTDITTAATTTTTESKSERNGWWRCHYSLYRCG